MTFLASTIPDYFILKGIRFKLISLVNNQAIYDSEANEPEFTGLINYKKYEQMTQIVQDSNDEKSSMIIFKNILKNIPYTPYLAKSFQQIRNFNYGFNDLEISYDLFEVLSKKPESIDVSDQLFANSYSFDGNPFSNIWTQTKEFKELKEKTQIQKTNSELQIKTISEEIKELQISVEEQEKEIDKLAAELKDLEISEQGLSLLFLFYFFF